MSLKLGTTDISGVPTALINTVNNKADISTVVNTRFDGQPVFITTTQISNTGTAGDYECDISTYLPIDTYNYEVLISTNYYDTDLGTIYIYSDLCPQTSEVCVGMLGGSSRRQQTVFWLPVGTLRKIHVHITTGGISGHNTSIHGYRRIGTNV